MEKLKRILAAIAAALLILVIVGCIWSAVAISIPVKAWPVWFGLPALVYFAWAPAVAAIKRLVDVAMAHDELLTYKGRK